MESVPLNEIVDHLRKALADRYTIEREIGSGGMATVYLAEDLKHHRKVAIKVLRADLAATLGPERFLREIEIAAQLHHPHILPLYDSGEADGFLYYVMPYVEGLSLRDKLAKEGELPIGDAVRIVRDVVDALTEAHAHGVVHRDIKPENILLRGRHALVTDFGVAKAVSEATGREQVTTAGVALGTPAYMAPEQAAADPHLDHRVDIYAVGAVAYELLTGRPVFMGTTPQMILSAHVTEAPQPVTKHRDTVPPVLEQLVLRCLEKKPADRFQSAEELLPQLETLTTPSGGMTPTETQPVRAATSGLRRRGWVRMALLAVAVGVVIAGAVAFGRWVRPGATGSRHPRTAIAVLPFDNIGGDPESEYFSAGITEDILAHLSKSTDIKVVRATQYAGNAVSMRGVGQELGVTTVLSGSVRQSGDDVRVVAQLVDTDTDETIWAETYDRKLESIFVIQTEIASNITEAMGTVLVTDAAGVEGPTADLEAYRLFLRARFLRSQRSLESVTQAVDLFEQAIARDSSFAEAWAGLAETWVLVPVYADATFDEALPRVLEAADGALALDPDLAAARTARGLALIMMAYDFDEGVREARRAVELDPGYAKAHHWLGIALAFQSNLEEALPYLERAAQLEPLSLIIHDDLARFAFFAGREEQAIAEFDKTIALDPRFAVAHIRSAEIYRLMGRHDVEAKRLERWNALLEVPAYRPGSIEAAFLAGGPEAMYRVLLQPSEWRTSEHAYHRAAWLVALGEHDAAIDVLTEEVAGRGQAAVMLTVSTSLAPLRGDPRFEALVEEVYGP